MTFHKEGHRIMAATFVVVALLSYINFHYLGCCLLLCVPIQLILFVFLFLIFQFFRIPNRTSTLSGNDIICPADGKVVVIEETEETEYFKDKRIQISIFMSPLNVHANYYPISGNVNYVKYHPGKFLVAWHPKSSTENERSTVVIRHDSGKEILFRQVAGALARRICLYAEKGETVKGANEFGFIKFGSRIDLFLPLGTQINVKIGDVVKGRITKIGEL